MFQRQVPQVQQTPKAQLPQRLAQPKRRDIFLHFFKTLKLISAVLIDRRVPVLRKLAFGGAVGICIVALLFPDTLVELGLSFALPVVGTVLGVPLDAGLDWTVLALAIVSLLKVFPAHVVSEHYERLFTPRWQARTEQQSQTIHQRTAH